MTDANPKPVTSKMAVVGFVLSLIPCASPLGILLGALSLARIKKSNGMVTGRGLAIAAVVIPLVALPLTGLALMPSIDRYRCGTVQTEARSVLRALHAAEESYRLEKGTYTTDAAALAFAPATGETLRYVYKVLDATADKYRAEARAGADLWTIDETGSATNVNDGCN